MPKFYSGQQLVCIQHRGTPPLFNEVVTMKKYSDNIPDYVVIEEYSIGSTVHLIFPESIFEPLPSDDTLINEFKEIFK